MSKINLFLVFLFFSSCSNKSDCTQLFSNAENLMGNDYLKKIVFPQDTYIYNNSISKNYSFEELGHPKFKYRILHFVDADCSTCIDKLKIAHSQKELFLKNSKAEILLILSTPNKEKLEYLMSEYKIDDLPIIYNLGYKLFKKENGLPLDDYLYDTMLLNSNNEVILFGNCFDNEKAKTLFLNFIECSR